MAVTQINPTRMELARVKKKLLSARRGHKLLKDKRDELIRRFIDLAKRTRRLHGEVENGIKTANIHFGLARAVMGDGAAENALSVPVRAIEIDVANENVMGVTIPKLRYKTMGGDAYPYGFWGTCADLDAGVRALSQVWDKMVQLAETEKACRLMADEIERTRRRVNALEHIIIPDCTEKIRYITMKLEENERGTQIRLLKVKDLMVGSGQRG